MVPTSMSKGTVHLTPELCCVCVSAVEETPYTAADWRTDYFLDVSLRQEKQIPHLVRLKETLNIVSP